MERSYLRQRRPPIPDWLSISVVLLALVDGIGVAIMFGFDLAVPCWLRTLFPGRVLDAKHCETPTKARNHPIPKTPVTIEELAIAPVRDLRGTSRTRKRSAVEPVNAHNGRARPSRGLPFGTIELVDVR
jgi:hypothetical protein